VERGELEPALVIGDGQVPLEQVVDASVVEFVVVLCGEDEPSRPEQRSCSWHNNQTGQQCIGLLPM